MIFVTGAYQASYTFRVLNIDPWQPGFIFCKKSDLNINTKIQCKESPDLDLFTMYQSEAPHSHL